MESSSFQPIRANPLLSTHKKLFVFFTAVIAIMVVFLIQMLVLDIIRFQSGGFARILSHVFSQIPIILLMLLNVLLNFQVWRYWNRVEQRRIAIVRGDRSLLAMEQPVPDAFALPLPWALTLGYRRRFLIQLAVCLWIILVAYGVLQDWAVSIVCSDCEPAFPDPLFIGAGVVAFSIIVFIFIAMSRGPRHLVQVSEVGILMNMNGKMSFVNWQEARLFAVYYSLGSQRNQSSLTYELSSMTDIVRWTDIISPSSAWFQMTPTIPLPEYRQQAQALNAMVAARTNLPLFDLR